MKIRKCTCGEDILLDDQMYYFLSGNPIAHSGGALCVTLNGKQINIARLVACIPNGLLPDHIDRNIHNNLASNIRTSTYSQNAANVSRRSSNKSGYIGVTYREDGRTHWQMTFTCGTFSACKRYPTAESAAARDLLAKTHFGAFAKLNFPEVS